MKTLATDDNKKRNRVRNQPRDRFGRWVSAGANVKWRLDGRNKSGIVTGFRGGVAIVNERTENGETSSTEVPVKDLQVLASKATIPQENEKFAATGETFADTLNNPEFKSKLEKEGSVSIEGKNGYKLEVKKGSEGNPLIYQLYAPTGRSLGIYSEGNEADLDDMVNDDAEPTEGAPEASGGTESVAVVASVEIVAEPVKSFRVPAQVRKDITEVLESGSATFSAEELVHAKALAYDETVSREDIVWINSFFSEIEAAEKLRGGFKGKKWASKILDEKDELDHGGSMETRYDFENTDYVSLSFFAVGGNELDPSAYALIAVDYETGTILTWKENGFEYLEAEDIESFEAPLIMELDTETAVSLAMFLDSNPSGEYDVRDSDAEERNLFLLAEAELDYEELGRMSAIVADATGYTPQERSVNATRQQRGPGGRFGGGQATGSSPEGKQGASFPKGKLTSELPLVPDVAARIAEWIVSAPEGALTASGEFAEEVPIEATETPAEEPTEAPAEESGASGDALYFAIVDEVDKTAVMDAFAIIKEGGSPKAYLRSAGTWAPSPETLQDVQGNTPPPVVELDIPEPAKSVLAQIDQHDSTQTEETTENQEEAAPIAASAAEFTDYTKETREKDAKKGFAMPSGAYPIHNVEDLKNAVKAFGRASESEKAEVKRHIKKRARALNRMDVIPEEWRSASVIERGEELASQSPLYGTYGEVIVAAGVPGIADAPSDFKAVRRLKNYWKMGKGAAKIRWGAEGDLTRCHRNLAKYLGSEDAWGYCQNIHQEIFGVSNAERDD